MLSSLLIGVLFQSVAVFDEPDFPNSGASGPLLDIPQARVAKSTEDLAQLLQEVNVLAWRHGANFPAESWPDLIHFLEGGGSLLHLSGEPFTHAVVGAPGARVVQPRSVSMLKELRLNQSVRVDMSGARLEYKRVHGLPAPTLAKDSWVSILEPRFSDTRDFADEDGAPGARDAILRPLAFLYNPTDEPNFPSATASFAIDRLRGRFAGGRWVFHLLDTPPSAEELTYLLQEASRKPVDLRVNPTFGCFHEGERPSVNLRIHRPLAEDLQELKVFLVVTRPDGSQLRTEHELQVGRHASELVALDVGQAPGLYRVVAFAQDYPAFETGFWIMDRELFASGDQLSMGSWSLLRNGQPEPVIGTTVMSGSVHRKFLFEPNAAEWSDTFAELASIDINLVRTGVWSGYKKISLDPNVVDEGFLRALEAYYLSARSHGLPVLFTFFSFMPEAFGGSSPYFDPRSIEGGRAYVAAIARRFSGAKEILWDLINEPSFANPDKLWQCRPNGDRFEHAAFTKWLRERYSGSPDGRTWQEVVRARWRLLPDEAIGIPTEDDFAERHVMESHRPYRAKEYVHFAQDAFRDWALAMSTAIRDSGSSAPITVGQDEGGLLERPSPLFHHDAVDFTSIHTWWFNDSLLWDGFMAKAPGKPMLVSESGIMQREYLSGEVLRTPQQAANLLERKIASAFASGAFGLVQWCYQVNPYMASDNEVGIGIRRVDGSYKPELDVLRRWAGFFARNRAALAEYREPKLVLVLPSSDLYGPRSFQEQGTKRVLRSLVNQLPVQVVPEHRTSADLGEPENIILPSCRGISDAAWRDIMEVVEKGATLRVSGWFETDDAGLPAHRLGAEKAAISSIEVQRGVWHPRDRVVRFSRAVSQSWSRANFGPDGTHDSNDSVYTIEWGEGKIIHHELPLDWSEDEVPRNNSAARAQLDAAGRAYTLQFGNELRLEIVINESNLPAKPWPSADWIPPGRARAAIFSSWNGFDPEDSSN